jgi:hypothetical protein
MMRVAFRPASRGDPRPLSTTALPSSTPSQRTPATMEASDSLGWPAPRLREAPGVPFERSNERAAMSYPFLIEIALPDRASSRWTATSPDFRGSFCALLRRPAQSLACRRQRFVTGGQRLGSSPGRGIGSGRACFDVPAESRLCNRPWSDASKRVVSGHTVAISGRRSRGRDGPAYARAPLRPANFAATLPVGGWNGAARGG